jgi:hypothetical protein
MKPLCKILLSTIAALAIFAASAQEFNKMLNVGSSIEMSSKGEEILKAGEFTVPKGYEAVNLRFKYADVASGESGDKLQPANILDLGAKKHIEIKGEIKTIPAGNYQLRIKGSIGACAILVYDLQSAKTK